jgi:hypothetical protein
MDRRNLTLGVVLLGVGLYFLLWKSLQFSGPGPILLLLGAIFLTLSALRRFRGPLLPGGVLLGLGTGFLLQDSLSGISPRWATLLFFLGCGFLLVALLDQMAGRERRPVPLIPGVILVAISLVAVLARQADLTEPVQILLRIWPWALVAAGVVLLLQGLRRSRKA